MRRFSTNLLQELRAAVSRALERDGLVNVPAIAWELKARFPVEDISIAELEAEVMALGMTFNAAMFFHRPKMAGQDPLCSRATATFH